MNALAQRDEAAGDGEVEVVREEADQTDRFANPVFSLPVMITVSVGRARMTIANLMNLEADAVIELDANVDDPVEIYIGEKHFASGDLVEIEEGGLGVRIVSLAAAK